VNSHNGDGRSKETLLSEIEDLRERNKRLEQRVAESEQTLEAIQSGEVDAILISTKNGDKIFTLKGAEEPYRILFEQMNEGAVTISEDGGILYANQSFARVMRTSLEKVFGTSIENYLDPREVSGFRDFLHQSTIKPVREQFDFQAKDGTKVPMQLSVSYLPSVGVPTYCIVAADMTERIKAEEDLNRAYGDLELKVQERTVDLQRTTWALEEATARLETILSKMPVAVVIIEPPSGKVVFFNEEANRQYRRKAVPLESGEDFTQYSTYHLDGRRYAASEYPMYRALTTGESVLNEIIGFERSDGTKGFANSNAVPVKDHNGMITAVIGLRFDITEQIEAEKELQAERNRLQYILDSLPVGVVVTNAAGQATNMNKVITDIIRDERSDSPDQIDLDKVVGYLPGEETPRKVMEWPVAVAMGRGTATGGQEIEIENKDGTRLSLLCFGLPIKGEDATIGGIATFVDITSQKNAEKALARSNEELKQFAYVASHDLQEPLRMVISYLSLLERRYRDQLDDQAKDYIDFAVGGGKRMKALIDDLLEYSRVDTQIRPDSLVDMNEVASRTLMNLELPIKESQAEIIVDDLPAVRGDRQQLGQVLQNLVSNAIKFRGKDRPEVHIGCSRDQEKWIFSVRDNGIGLEMEYAQRIFQMFQRLHSNEKYEGTGVGLAIVKKIVERHGGKVWVESQVGNGAAFFFSIPK
jgi:PAS domain S-box-containing protein